jgi:uncharacterized RDD family membrane protein YckC
VAWALDVVARLLILVIVLVPTFTLLGAWPGAEAVGVGLAALFMFLLDWFYGAFFETVLAGRTPGKMVMSLRVVRQDGAPAQFPDFFLRNLLRAVDFLPTLFGVGLIVMLIDPKLRRIGDLVAGTVVVLEAKGHVLGGGALDQPVSEEERQALPPRVDLRRDEIEVIETFLRRRRLLSAERAEELAMLFGPALAARTGVTAPTWGRVLLLAYARATGKDR